MNDIENVIKTLQSGGIAIFPTDTVYGIGCRMDNEEAVKKVFNIRNRPSEKAVLVLVDSIEMVKKYAAVPADIEALMNAYWPTELTIVLPCYLDKVPSVVRGGGLTLGFRMPDFPQLCSIITHVGVPLVAPSANKAGEPTPLRREDLDEDLKKQADYVWDTEVTEGQPSTVLDCSVTPWKVLRQGKVKITVNDEQ